MIYIKIKGMLLRLFCFLFTHKLFFSCSVTTLNVLNFPIFYFTFYISKLFSIEKHDCLFIFRGQTPAQAELNFLEVAKKIPRYGISEHDAQVNYLSV